MSSIQITIPSYASNYTSPYFRFLSFRHCFRFSQLFIDIREKERKRLQRGLISIPPKYPKIDEKLLTENNDTDESAATINRDDNPNGFKPEHLLELQEKITKEILSTRLQENEMQELQVCAALCCFYLLCGWHMAMRRNGRIEID